MNFMTPGAGVPVLTHGHFGEIEEMHFFLNVHFYSKPSHRQNEYKVIITKNCKFHDPQRWGSDIRRGHLSHYSEYVLNASSTLYTAH